MTIALGKYILCVYISDRGNLLNCKLCLMIIYFWLHVLFIYYTVYYIFTTLLKK